MLFFFFKVLFVLFTFLFRVLEAGKANVILPKSSPSGITHVIASNARIKAEQEKDHFKAPFYPIQYLGDFLLEVSKISKNQFLVFIEYPYCEIC